MKAAMMATPATQGLRDNKAVMSAGGTWTANTATVASAANNNAALGIAVEAGLLGVQRMMVGGMAVAAVVMMKCGAQQQ